MKIIKGNLINLALEGKFDVIVHGCNCFHTMGAGFARQTKEAFPEAYQADLETEYGRYNKMGTISSAAVWRDQIALIVVNAYTQFRYSRKNSMVSYDAIAKAMKLVKEQCSGSKIAYPKIGCGLAGGDWNVVSEIIDTELQGEDHTLVVYDTKRI